MTNDLKDLVDDNEEHKHLVFRLAHELYAAKLVAVREIIKMPEIKPVPFMVNYFRGILNLRGLIVSVVDLRLKLELPCQDQNSGLLIIVDTEGGAIAAVVDDIVCVKNFPPESVTSNISLRTKIPVEFFLGVGHLDSRMVNIINIAATLTSDDFAVVKRIRDKAAVA